MIKFVLLLSFLIIISFVPVFATSPKCDGITDDTNTIQSMINAKNATLPRGVCIITNTLYIGTGTNTTQSTIHSLFLTGQGFEAGHDESSYYCGTGTCLLWKGPIGQNMISVRGPINDITISKIDLDGLNSASSCIYSTHMMDSKFDQVRCQYVTKTDYVFAINASIPISGVNEGGCRNIFNQLMSDSPSNNLVNGIKMLQAPNQSMDYCRNQFNDLQIMYGGASGSYGIYMSPADNNYFMGGMIASPGVSGGCGVYLSYFSNENVFMGTAIPNGICGNPSIGDWFMPYPTIDSEPIPTIPHVHYMLYNGTIH